MAEVFYLLDTLVGATSVNEHLNTQRNGSAPADAAFATPTGWVTDSNAAGQSSILNSLAEVQRTSGFWSATLQPAGALNAPTGDAWRTPTTLSGTFAEGAWTISAALRAETAAYAGRFRLRWRVWKSANADGSSATELTTSTQVTAATTANLSTSATQTLSVTWTPGSAIVLSAEYLFFQLGIEITQAGTGNTQDVHLRKAATSAITTPDLSGVVNAVALSTGASTASAVPSVERKVSGLASAGGTLAAGGAALRKVAALSSGSSSAAAAASSVRKVAAAAVSSSTLSASTQGVVGAAASVAGTSTAFGTVSLVREVAVELASTSALFGAAEVEVGVLSDVGNVGSFLTARQAFGTQTTSTARIGSESFALAPIGSETTARVLTPAAIV